MSHSRFEKLIRKNEEDLQRIRNAYFPLIKERIITGYNLYSNLFDYSKRKLFLNYLHSNLRPEDKHFKELSRILKKRGFLEGRAIINNELVDQEELLERDATYITKPDWKDSQNMRYFTFRGREMSFEEAKKFRREVIGEVLQYDLLLRIKDEIELRQVVDLFKKYTSKHVLDKYGRKIIKDDKYVDDKNAISGAWNVPLLIFTSKNNKKPKNLVDFLTVNQFNIQEKLGKKEITLSTLIKSNKEEFYKILEKRKDKFTFDKKYALRVFVEDYIDT